MMKQIIYLSFIVFICIKADTIVLRKDQCTCTSLKSENDCISGADDQICEWKIDDKKSSNGYCKEKSLITIPYCEQINKEICSKEIGCAFLNSKCTHFTGCTAYAKSTNEECQQISFKCVSDGISCIEAIECVNYKNQDICEKTPSLSGNKKCKWDIKTGTCRDYLCMEAEYKFQTDEECEQWLSGCITRGQGCWTSPLPSCSEYEGDQQTCAQFFGADGKCEFQLGETKCQPKSCTNAPTSLSIDSDCVSYQKECISIGKGCIQAAILPLCSTYQGDTQTCMGYIGIDGVCEGYVGGTHCRSRLCEHAPPFKTDQDCGKFKQGCKTNGKGCVQTLGLCSSYFGVITICEGYIGTDGYCTGISKKSFKNCIPKACEDAPNTLTSDSACNSFQIGCKTTGQGCVKILPQCNEYFGDQQSCLQKIGKDGKCTWINGTNCIVRTCEQAPISIKTNEECYKWQINCVTNGFGCIQITTCDQTNNQLSCQGTQNCQWQPICTSNEGCNAFKSVSICAANKARVFDYNKYTYKADGITPDTTTSIYKFVSCAWRSGQCYQMECSDLTGTFYATDANCNAALTGCISNKKDACITGLECSKLTGTMDTCKGYSNAYCTNTADASATSACVQKKCADNIDAIDTITCNQWLPGCVSNGKGCVDYNTACTSLTGTQATCNELYGYSSGTINSFTTVQCYNTDNATATTACVVKTCSQAAGKTSDSECSQFLTGCVYNGKDSCIDSQTAICADFYHGSDNSYCEKVMIKNKFAKYCFGTGANGNCKTRACSDNKTAEDQTTCDNFKSGCILKSSKGCDDYANIACTSQQGTITTCPNFFGNVSSVKVRCTKLDSCQDRQCSDIKTPTQASDCTTWKSSCRFVKSGSPCIDATVCSDYRTPDTATNDAQKFAYCTSITDISGKLCGFVKGMSICFYRACEQVLSEYNSPLACSTYYVEDITTGSTNCKQTDTGSYCYTPKSDCTYTFASSANTDPLKTTYCQLFFNDKNVQCTFKTGDGTCTAQSSCEKVITATNAKTCNDIVGGANICQKGTNGTGCTTTAKITCNSYSVPDTLTDANKLAFCQSLKVIDDTAKFANGDGVYSSCIWKSGASTCDVIATCADIPSAQGQADCEAQKSGCLYYNGKCIAKAATCPSSFPQGVSTSSQKAEFCMANFESTTNTYCQLKDDGSTCIESTNTDCFLTLPFDGGLWNGTAITAAAYCQDHSTKDKKIYCVADPGDATKCKRGTCEDVPSPTKQGDCDKYVLGCYYLNSKCNTIQIIADAFSDCGDIAKVLFGANIQAATTAQKFAYCNSLSKDGSTEFCSYDGTSSKCEAAAATCAGLTPTVGSELTFCQSRVNTTGDKCSWTSGVKCRDWDCHDIASPQSQVDCDIQGPGIKCRYFKGACNNTASTCDIIPVVGATAADKKIYCEGITASTACIYVAGAFCTPVGNCETYDVNAIASAADKLTACNTLTDGSSNACTFVPKGSVTKCAKKDTCYTYVVDASSESTQCLQVKSSLNFPCNGDTGNSKCKAFTCEDITTGSSDCGTNASGCLYYSSACITKKACHAYSFPSNVNTDPLKTTWCTGVTDSSGNLCKWDGTTKCADRVCSDVKYYTDFDCNAYLKGCKTNGTICVTSSTACNTLNGDDKLCNSITDSRGKDKCQPAITVSTSSGNCEARTCYNNVYSTSDSDCNTFMSGCVTRGTGCIPNTATCDQYRGTKTTCEAFKQYISTDANGNITYKYCSGDAANTATSPCKNRVCDDNTTATDDTTCKAYLSGCVSAGSGCIEARATCTQYKGTDAQCSKFMGNSGYDYCQGTASDAITSAACRKRLCSDISATNDKDCYNGMKPFKNAAGKDIYVFCVYDGVKSCVDNNKYCSFFKGNVETCPLYTATDGPCKATTIGSNKGPCAKRVCTEAPNTLTTDADCKAYHPTCYTTGFGCTTNNSCSSLSNQASCSSRVTCTWTNQCKSAITTCSTFSNTSQSQCVNTKVNGYYCAWSETGSLCRNQTCADQPGTITDHSTCQAFSESCTTSGAGFISVTACLYYTVQSVCLAASTTKDGVSRCGWENNACRPRACNDKSATTTAECDTFLSGCKTNGTTCVAAKTCTDFNGNQQYCQKSQNGRCLYVNGICYDYTQCEDAPGNTHAVCQTFSPLCTTNETNCIPITSCEKTTLKASCVVGTDGACGWLPAGGTNATEKCQKFGACTDAVGGATNDVCYAYGSTCVSDGTNCIAKTTCSSYMTAAGCNNNGIDGLCFWNAANNQCKLKDCGDSTANNTTNDGCASFSVASGSCTTDGTKCIPLSTCSSYVEAGCVQGTDGVCIFAVAVGATTGTKTCRLKACEDITGGTTNGACIGISPKKCVSNGTSCIAKAACTTYTSKTACNGGGVDSAGIDVTCAFTVTDTTKPNIGTCKQFSQCSDANKDQIACAIKPGICQWKAAGTTSSCTAYACDTIVKGTNCQPVPSFDEKSYTVCNLVNGQCTAADPGTITDTNCYTKSAYTYSWNTETSKCVRCVAGSTVINNTTINPNNTNTINNHTTTTYEYLVGVMTLGFLGFMV